MNSTKERSQEWNGGIYVIRDVWREDGKHERCEYAVMDGDQMAWKPCIEGVLYADIEPLRRVDAKLD